MVVNLGGDKFYKVHVDRVKHAEPLRGSETDNVKAKVSDNSKEGQKSDEAGQRPSPPKEPVKETHTREYQPRTNGKSRYGRVRFQTSRYQAGQ